MTQGYLGVGWSEEPEMGGRRRSFKKVIVDHRIDPTCAGTHDRYEIPHKSTEDGRGGRFFLIIEQIDGRDI